MKRREFLKLSAATLTGAAISIYLPAGWTPAKAAAKWKVGFSQATTLEPWRVQFNKDIEAEAKNHPEVELIITDGQDKTEKQVADVENLIAQQVDKFDPSPEEVQLAEEEAARVVIAPTALKLALDATALPASVLGDLKDVLAGFPGDADVVIELRTSIGPRRLRLGPDFRVTRSSAIAAELDALLGEAILGEEIERPEPVLASGAA